MIDLAKDLKDKTQKNIDHVSIMCPYHNRMATLSDVLLTEGGDGKTIVFTETKREADDMVFAEQVSQKMEALHGDVPQFQR